jgi:hypothetical protein
MIVKRGKNSGLSWVCGAEVHMSRRTRAAASALDQTWRNIGHLIKYK